jgi:Carboxypeptidase regulatory-like domain
MDIERHCSLALILLGCVACGGVRPTLAAGALSGHVLDQTGMPLMGVTVEARRHGGPARHTRTDEEGGFRLTGLPPGRYRVRASARTLKPVVQNGVQVPAAGVGQVQLIMEVKVRDESGRALERAADSARPSPLPPPASGGRGQTFPGDSVVACLAGAGVSATAAGSVSGFVLDQTVPTPARNLRPAADPAGCGAARSTS